MKSDGKRLPALAMALLLILALLGGCGGSPGSGEAAATDAPAPESAAPPASETETAEPGPSGAAGYFPLSEDLVTLRWYFEGTVYDQYTSFAEIDSFVIMQDLTNVRFEFTTPGQGTEDEAFNIMIASGDYPEIISNMYARHTAGIDSALDEGIILPLNDYAGGYMPDYMAVVNSDPEITKQAYTDSGVLWGVHLINQTEQKPFIGNIVRQDWLDKYGLDTPVTFDDWDGMLAAFLLEDTAAKGPLYMLMNGFADQWMAYSHGYNAGLGIGTSDLPFIQKDGEVVYSPVTEGWKTYLEIMSDWYAKGYIYKDFASQMFINVETPATTGEIGVWDFFYNTVDYYESVIGNGAKFAPLTSPVLKEGDGIHLRNQTNMIRAEYTACLSSSCTDETLEICLRYLNYFFTEDGARIANYGTEGVSYEMAGGRPQFTELMYKNPDGISISDMQAAHVIMNGPVWYDWTRELITVSDNAASFMDAWMDGADTAYQMPDVTLTADEANEYASVFNECSTYVNEYVLKCITGETDVDGAWDDYVATLESMDIQTAIDIQQAALDRYNSR